MKGRIKLLLVLYKFDSEDLDYVYQLLLAKKIEERSDSIEHYIIYYDGESELVDTDEDYPIEEQVF